MAPEELLLFNTVGLLSLFRFSTAGVLSGALLDRLVLRGGALVEGGVVRLTDLTGGAPTAVFEVAFWEALPAFAAVVLWPRWTSWLSYM